MSYNNLLNNNQNHHTGQTKTYPACPERATRVEGSKACPELVPKVRSRMGRRICPELAVALPALRSFSEGGSEAERAIEGKPLHF